MTQEPLSPQESAVWHAWTGMTETVRGLVAREIADAAGLSDPDYGILSRLADLGGGRLRQHELAASMNWSKSRLSHQLSRMQGRGLVDRARSGDGAVAVAITRAGREALDRARPVHATAVRRHLLERLGPSQVPVVLDMARKLNAAALEPRAHPRRPAGAARSPAAGPGPPAPEPPVPGRIDSVAH